MKIKENKKIKDNHREQKNTEAIQAIRTNFCDFQDFL